MSSNSNLKIAKNTLFLSIRMLLNMGVSLYTSRVVLEVLGIEDYGIYSVVGGVVTLFSFFNTAMSSATQRFLAFDLGKKDEEQLHNTFNATFIIHVFIAALILILAETLGSWFINNKLNVPLDRIRTINWVYQFSILTFLVGVIQVPFNALIIAREQMNIYAIISVIEVTLKLIIVYLLILFDLDKLKLYSILIFVVTLLVALFYQIYCYTRFKESKFRWYYDSKYFRVLISYSGWNLFGNIAGLAKGQGLNIVLNLFFGPFINAAYGIMQQVQGTVSTFVSNFQMSVNPQIIKSYANNELRSMISLVFRSAKYSYFLMLLVTFPIIYNTELILTLWLKIPPEGSVWFVRLCLINILIDCISGPLMTAAQATGKIKWYQIIVGFLLFLNLPLSYFLLLVLKEPNIIFYISILLSLVALNFRLFFLKKSLGISAGFFYKEVMTKVVAVTIAVSGILYFVLSPELAIKNIFLSVAIKSLIIMLVILAAIATVGINRYEKELMRDLIMKKTVAKWKSLIL